MTVRVHTVSPKTVKIIEKILLAGNFSFVEKNMLSESKDISANDLRSIIKSRKPRIVGKSLQNL